MTRFVIAVLSFALLLAGPAGAQSGAVIPQGGAGHAAAATCVILKRMGPADQVTSHLYSFGIRGKQFQYVEGKLPDGFPFHGRLTDHDVRNLQGRGAEIVVLNSNFTSDDLKQARADCRGETGQTPNQAEAKGPPSESTKDASPTNPATPNPIAAPSGARLSVVSIPDGADIEVDGSFVGNTPSDVQVTEGEHTVAVKKAGFKDWERKLKVSAGSNVHLNAELEQNANP
jgi:PEGA domain-containing protein